MKDKDFKLILEDQLGITLSEQEWNNLMNNSKNICRKDLFQFLSNESRKIRIDSNILISATSESNISTSLPEQLAKNTKSTERIVKTYDQKIWDYIEKDPANILSLAFDVLQKKPSLFFKLLFTTKTGLFFTSILLLSIILTIALTIMVLRRTGKFSFLGMNLSGLYFILDEFDKIKHKMNVPHIVMYMGTVLFTISLFYDFIFSKNTLIGWKQMIGMIIGILLIIFGFFAISGSSKTINNLPFGIQKYLKSMSYLLLMLGLLLTICSLFIDYFYGRSFFIGIKQFFLLISGMIIILIAYMLNK
jgi:hypothetical protein